LIDRYSRPQMASLWTDEEKLKCWLAIELAVCSVQHSFGNIPDSAWNEIKSKAKFDSKRIKQIEAEVKHDVIAFLTSVKEHVGESARYIHLGLTSSDVIDTGLALQLVKAGALIENDLEQLENTVADLAKKHKYTLQIGRSHGVHAEPITFGFKMAVWLAEIRRHKEHLKAAIKTISVGKISGAVGTYANIPPIVEEKVCQLLGLDVEPVSTQIVQRDRHAHFINTLALIACSLDKFATEIRHLQKSEVLEVEEAFTEGQKGSSAMPHKRNPVGCENISGLARLVRGYAIAAMENVTLWHERDISHSSVERVIMPDATILIDFMLDRLNGILKHLVVYPENMELNLNRFGGVVYSQAILLKLIDKGLSREDAYKLVQDRAMSVWNKTNGNFKNNLLKDPEIIKVLSKEEIEECFQPQSYIKNIDHVYKRLKIES
jgi:adenylosuccinate lyase